MPHLDGRRILVVDDTQGALEMFVSFLRAAGATVFPASSMDEALAVAAQENIDTVVTDLAMPGGDGLVRMPSWKSRSHRPIWCACWLSYDDGAGFRGAPCRDFC
jgi:CheY-like chemotaxis protein